MGAKAKEDVYILKFESIIPTFIPRQRALRRALKGKTSTWLNVLPLQNYHFDLSPLQFRDGLAIRYLRDPPCLSPRCDGRGATLTLQHALDCKKGGLIIQDTMKSETAWEILHHRYGHMSSRNQLSERLRLTMEMVG